MAGTKCQKQLSIEMNMEKLFTVQEAANYLNCHQMTVRKMISQRKIPYIKKRGIGIRLRKGDLDTWLNRDLHSPEGWNVNI